MITQGRAKWPWLIQLTETLIIPDIAKFESNNCLLPIILNKITINTDNRTKHRLTLLFGNRALRAQPPDSVFSYLLLYLMYRFRLFQKLTVGP